MDPTTPNLLVDLPKLLCLVLALVGGAVAAATWWRRHRPSAIATAQPAASPGKIIYQDAPTVRVVDSQRVDRIRKIVRLATNESVDILESRGSPVPRFRLTLKEVMKDATPAVRLVVEYGGTPLSCGPLVKELGHNEFLLPRVARDEHRSAILHFHERGDALDFMRIKLRGVDVATSVAEIDVMQVSGNWPAAS
jgi:hypothetical protein